MVSGKSGGNNYTAGQPSFHGSQEIVAEKYQLCAREMEPHFGVGHGFQWVNFTSCMNGFKGIAICTRYDVMKMISPQRSAPPRWASIGPSWMAARQDRRASEGRRLSNPHPNPRCSFRARVATWRGRVDLVSPVRNCRAERCTKRARHSRRTRLLLGAS